MKKFLLFLVGILLLSSFASAATEYCMDMTLEEFLGIERVEETVHFNITGLQSGTSLVELEIFDDSCINGGNAVPYDPISSTDTMIEVAFLMNVSANSNTTYSVIYGNHDKNGTSSTWGDRMLIEDYGDGIWINSSYKCNFSDSYASCSEFFTQDDLTHDRLNYDANSIDNSNIFIAYAFGQPIDTATSSLIFDGLFYARVDSTNPGSDSLTTEFFVDHHDYTIDVAADYTVRSSWEIEDIASDRGWYANAASTTQDQSITTPTNYLMQRQGTGFDFNLLVTNQSSLETVKTRLVSPGGGYYVMLGFGLAGSPYDAADISPDKSKFGHYFPEQPAGDDDAMNLYGNNKADSWMHPITDNIIFGEPIMMIIQPPTIQNPTYINSSDQTPTIIVECVDVDGCEMVKMYNDSSLTYDTVSEINNCTYLAGNNWSCTSTETLKGGLNQLYFWGLDTLGNNNTNANLTIDYLVDTTPPTIANATYTNSSDQTPVIIVECFDDDGCEMVKMNNDSSLTYDTVPEINNCTYLAGNNWSCTSTETLKGGLNQLYFWGLDDLGNYNMNYNLTIDYLSGGTLYGNVTNLTEGIENAYVIITPLSKISPIFNITTDNNGDWSQIVDYDNYTICAYDPFNSRRGDCVVGVIVGAENTELILLTPYSAPLGDRVELQLLPPTSVPVFISKPNSTQQYINQQDFNIVCEFGNVNLWFDNNSNPATLINGGNNPSPFIWTTNVSSTNIYYFKAQCTGGSVSTIYNATWNFSAIGINDISFITTGGFIDNNRFLLETIDSISANVSSNGNNLISNISVKNGNGVYIIINESMTNISEIYSYNDNIYLDNTGTWTIEIYSEDDTTTNSGILTFTVSGRNVTIYDNDWYAWGNKSLLSNTSIDSLLIQYSINLIEVGIKSSELDNTNWALLKENLERASASYVKGGINIIVDESIADQSKIDEIKSEINTYFGELITGGYAETTRYINIEIATADNDENKTTAINQIAESIIVTTTSQFPVYTTNSNLNFDTSYTSNSTLHHIDCSTNATWITDEKYYAQNSVVLNRLYNTSETSILINIENYQTNVINNFRSTIDIESTLSSDYGLLLNEDIIIFNVGDTSEIFNADVSSLAGILGKEVFDITAEELIEQNTDGIFKVILKPYSANYVLFDIYDYGLLTGSVTTIFGQFIDHTKSQNYTDGTNAGTFNIHGATDIRIQLWNPTYIKPNFLTYYGWLNASYENFSETVCDYNLLIFDDGVGATANVGEVREVLHARDIKGCPDSMLAMYVSVSDYDNTEIWQASKEAEVDAIYNINSSLDIFVDGLDIGLVEDINFSIRFKRLSDYIRYSKNMKAIFNTYTAYKDFCGWGDGCMKESCINRWNGTDAVNIDAYGREVWSLEVEKARWYNNNNIEIYCQSFGNKSGGPTEGFFVQNTTDLESIFLASKVLGYDNFYFSQPDFQYVMQFRHKDLGESTERDFTCNDDTTLCWKSYENGIVYYNSTSQIGWVEENLVINNITLEQFAYDNGNAGLEWAYEINKESTSDYQYISPGSIGDFTGKWLDTSINVSHLTEQGGRLMVKAWIKDRGALSMAAYYDIVNGVGRNSWWDVGTPNSWNLYDLDKNWMFNLKVNQSRRSGNQLIETINQTENVINTGTAFFNRINISSGNKRFNLTVESDIFTLAATTFDDLYFINSTTERVLLTPLNTLDCISDNPTFNTEIIEDKEIGSCYILDGTTLNFRTSVPHLSDEIFEIEYGTPPPISVIKPLSNTFVSHESTIINWTQGNSSISFNTTIVLTNDTGDFILVENLEDVTSYEWNTHDWTHGNTYNITLFNCNYLICGLNTTISNVTINADINITSIYILPTIAYNNNSLYGYITADTNDSHIFSVNYSWYRNGIEIITGYNDTGFTGTGVVNVAKLDSSYLNVYDNFTFSAQVVDPYDVSEWANSTVRIITNRVLRDLTVYLPANDTHSNLPMNVSFSVVDEDEGIYCDIVLNESSLNAENISISSGIITNQTITLINDETYIWNISCISDSDETAIFSSDYIYVYDTTAPVYSNPQTDESLIYPEIGDTFHMNMSIIDGLSTIDVCKLTMNDTQVWENKTSYVIEVSDYKLETEYVIQSYSTTNISAIGWKIWCNDTVGNEAESTIQEFEVKDITNPIITRNSDTSFDDSNRTVISNYFNNVTLNFTFIDSNLFQAMVNITCETNGTIHYWEIVDFNTTTYNYVATVDISEYELQRCDVLVAAADDHTKNEIGKYKIDKKDSTVVLFTKEKIIVKEPVKEIIVKEYDKTVTQILEVEVLEFKTEENILIQVIPLDDKNNIKKISTKKENDRYKFGIQYKDSQNERSIRIVSNVVLFPQVDSSYDGHFVAWNDKTKQGNWIDLFEGDFNDNTRTYEFYQIDEYTYDVKIYDINGITEFNFESIGGSNVYNETYEFYIGGVINLTSINIYDNSSVNNFCVDITPLDEGIMSNESICTDITCYQESVNVSTTCGGLDTGYTSFPVSTPSGRNCTISDALIDGNWSTLGVTVCEGGGPVLSLYAEAIIAYSVPARANVSTSKLKVKWGNEIIQYFTIPSSCATYAQSNGTLIFVVNNYWGNTPIYTTTLECVSNVGGVSTSIATNNIGPVGLYEEGMIWNGTFLDDQTWYYPIQNGSYQLDFYNLDDQYFNQTNIIEVENTTQDVIIDTFQSAVTIYYTNIASGDPVVGALVKLTNNGSGQETYQTTNTLGFVEFHINSSDYDVLANGGVLINNTKAFTVSDLENLTLNYVFAYNANFTFYDESTLGPFNISSADSIIMIVQCQDSTQQYTINDTNQLVPIECDYRTFKFILDYGDSLGNYYRTFILPAYDEDIYLINLETTDAIFNNFRIDDLMNEYDNPRIYITRQINTTNQIMTSAYVDIEDKIGAYLILNREYNVRIVSDNNPDYIVGAYSADSVGDKVIRLYDVGVYPGSATQNYVDDVRITSYYNDSSDIIYYVFNDTKNYTQSVTYSVYEGSVSDGIILYADTVTVAEDGTIDVQITGLNASDSVLVLQTTSIRKDSILTDVAKVINAPVQVALAFVQYLGDTEEERFQWMNLFFIILLGVLMLFSTMSTAAWTSILVVGFAALFKVFNLVRFTNSTAWDWAILGLASFVAISSMFAGGSKK